MSIRKAVLSLGTAAILFTLGTAYAGDFKSQTRFGSNFFSSQPPCPVRDFPTFENIAPVPTVFDLDAFNMAEFVCSVDVSKKGNGVNKAKGTFDTDLIVIDHTTGTVEHFDIDSGKFKTNSEGSDSFDFEIPTELFADGFESGDVSAWSYTRAHFTNKKKADTAAVSCGGAESVHILSAFFGLDNGVPGLLFGCGLSGLQDGMPIVLDRRIPLPALLDPSVFVVHRASGAESPVGCATLAPADEAEERRTILLLGEFASDGDPPVGVEIVGTLLTDDGVDAKGALVETVVPLAAGPSIVLAEHYLISELPTGGTDECPADTDHIIKTTWDGGVSGPGGADLDESHRLGTTVEYASGEVRVATLLADAFDNDNHVEFCMSAPGEPVAITAGSGLYEDPNGDLNVLHTQVVTDAHELTP